MAEIVTQADRDAAFPLQSSHSKARFDRGDCDHWALVQAFARHRQSTEAVIATRLREMAPSFQPSMNSKAALEFAADALEQGKIRHG